MDGEDDLGDEDGEDDEDDEDDEGGHLVDGDEAVAEVDEHPRGDHDRVHPRQPLHQHQRHPDTLQKSQY